MYSAGEVHMKLIHRGLQKKDISPQAITADIAGEH